MYPGFLQVAGFMGLDPKRHLNAFAGVFTDVVSGNDTAERTTKFYAECFAVLDTTAVFYLDTARGVFQEQYLDDGRLQWRGQRVNPAAIKTALMTVVGRTGRTLPGRTNPSRAQTLHRDPKQPQATPPVRARRSLRLLQRNAIPAGDLPRDPLVHRCQRAPTDCQIRLVGLMGISLYLIEGERVVLRSLRDAVLKLDQCFRGEDSRLGVTEHGLDHLFLDRELFRSQRRVLETREPSRREEIVYVGEWQHAGRRRALLRAAWSRSMTVAPSVARGGRAHADRVGDG